jgi:hypothetical protein
LGDNSEFPSELIGLARFSFSQLLDSVLGERDDRGIWSACTGTSAGRHRRRHPRRVEHWLAAQRAGGASLELGRPLSAQLGCRRALLRYLPAQRAHPGAIIISEGAPAQGRDLELLGLSSREAQVVALVTTGVANAVRSDRLQLARGQCASTSGGAL